MNLHFSGICKSFGGKIVLENISGEINNNDKIGLVGVNGIGKTTLARLLAGRDICDQGEIKCSPSNVKIIYAEQYPQFEESNTVFEEALKAAQNNYDLKDAKTIVRKSLNQLRISEEKWGQKANILSGGEKTKLSLCRVMVSDFDLLILDEPTNHLDINSCGWLEEYILSLAKTMVIISHDRFFLDKVVKKIWELSYKGLKVYEGNYSDYRIQKEIEQKSIAREYEKQQFEIRQLKRMINERKNWYNSAHRTAGQNDFYRSKAKKHASVFKAKKRQLERIEKKQIAKPVKLITPEFDIINKNIVGKKLPSVLVHGVNVSKSFAENILFDTASFSIKRGDKIALVGPNGAGKTTFLKIIAGVLQDYSGTVTVSPAVKMGYFAQELDNLKFEATILEDALAAGTTVEEARLLLACLLFRGDDINKKIADLSMGEKGRVAFAKLILTGANFLILDEPTNYMDIESKEKIEEVLGKFKGCLLFVSHDRYFIKKLANKVFAISNLKLNCYNGGYEYYLTKLKENKIAGRLTGIEYKDLIDNIIRLECELAYLGGKLNEKIEDEKENKKLQDSFLLIARRLSLYKELMEKKQ